MKIKKLNFSRDDFAQRGRKKRPLLSTPKYFIYFKKIEGLTDVASALENVAC